jgi:hypothetical protein
MIIHFRWYDRHHMVVSITPTTTTPTFRAWSPILFYSHSWFHFRFALLDFRINCLLPAPCSMHYDCTYHICTTTTTISSSPIIAIHARFHASYFSSWVKRCQYYILHCHIHHDSAGTDSLFFLVHNLAH